VWRIRGDLRATPGKRDTTAFDMSSARNQQLPSTSASLRERTLSESGFRRRVYRTQLDGCFGREAQQQRARGARYAPSELELSTLEPGSSVTA
jgi:hypothetical protein